MTNDPARQVSPPPSSPLAHSLHQHHYPRFLLRWPRLIHLLYFWNGLVLQRNWLAGRALRRLLPQLPPGSLILDAGCGEGMHLLPWAGRFHQLDFLGIDQLENHLVFGRRYTEVSGLENVGFQQAELENFSLKKKAALVTCIGVLQYIQNDGVVLKKIYNILSSKGLAIFYIPINGRMLLPPYRYFFGKKMHYERSQHRVRVYEKDEFLAKLEAAGFRVKKQVSTYGTLGTLGHEIYSLLIMGLGNTGWLAWFFGLLLLVLFPIVLLLKGVDFLIKKRTGNGLLIIAGCSED